LKHIGTSPIAIVVKYMTQISFWYKWNSNSNFLFTNKRFCVISYDPRYCAVQIVICNRSI